MKRLFFMLFIAYSTLQIAESQPTQEWVRRYSDTSFIGYSGSSIRTDSLGNIYVLTRTSNKFGFIKYDVNGNLIVNTSYWPGGYLTGGGTYFDVSKEGNVYITGSVDSNFLGWIYTVKFNTNGVFQWGKLYNSDNDDGSNDIKVDRNGDIIVVGGSVVGSSNFALILKYNSNGDTLWTRHFNNGQNYAIYNKFVLDDFNNIYIAGNLSTPGVCLIMKYNSNGSQQWFTTFTNNPTRSNGGHGICLDVNGNLYVLGTESVPSSLLNNFLLKINNNGSITWNRVFTGILTGQGRTAGTPAGPVVSGDGNSVYFSTKALNGMGAGGYSIATIKYTSNGDSQWVKVFSGGGIYGRANRISNIKLDKSDNIYICGSGNYQTTGDDLVTIKYTSAGNQQWVATNTGLVTNGGDNATDLYIDTNFNVYVTGSSDALNNPGVAVTIKYSQVIGIAPISTQTPNEYNLSQNYPNPFNPSTNIKYQIVNNNINVKLTVFDIAGREVAVLVNEKQSSGTYEVTLNAQNFPSGIYFYELSTEKYTETKKMVLIK